MIISVRPREAGNVEFPYSIVSLESTNHSFDYKTYDKARNAVALALSPVVQALVDPDGVLQQIRDLDNVSFYEWFMSKGGMRASIQRMWDPVAYAFGFIDYDNISAQCMLTIFTLFATKTEAFLLRMLKGSPDVYLSGPIKKYIIEKRGRFYLRWGCREVLYETSSDGSIYVSGLAMSKVLALFPSSQGLGLTWASVVKIGIDTCPF